MKVQAALETSADELVKNGVEIFDGSFLLKVSEDRLSAFVYPQDEGNAASVRSRFHELLQEVQRFGISFGFLPGLEATPNSGFIISKGKSAVDGEDARVRPVVLPTGNYTPKIAGNNNDQVDHRELGHIVNVRKGQLLLEKIPATAGSPGMDVFGVHLPARAGSNVSLKCGSGTELSADGLKVTAMVQGEFVMEKGRPVVSQEHVLAGDVDTGVGNISFGGNSLVVEGKVKSGFKVACVGDISIGQGVENASVLADGTVSITGGVVGHESTIRAKGDIHLDFCENSKLIESQGSLLVNGFVVQGEVKVAGDIKALGDKGALIGGTYIAGGSIFVKDLGSDGEVLTELSVGLDPALAKRKNIIAVAREIVPGRLNDIIRNISTLTELKKNMGKDFPEDKESLLLKLNELMPKMMDKSAMLTELEKQLAEDLSRRIDDGVYVYGTVYPGVRVNIGPASKLIMEEESQVVIDYKAKDQKIQIRGMSKDEARLGEELPPSH